MKANKNKKEVKKTKKQLKAEKDEQLGKEVAKIMFQKYRNVMSKLARE